MYQIVPNIDTLFAEAGPDAADRVRAAAAAGFDAVEMFGTSGKDVDALAKVVDDLGVAVSYIVAEPFANFTLPHVDTAPFLDGLQRGVDHAHRLGAPRLVVTTGVGFPGANRKANLERVVEALQVALERTAGSGVKLVTEAVNTRVDHPGALLDNMADAISVARALDTDRFALVYDVYHSVVNGEEPAEVLADAGDLIDHVDVADAPGRGEPGTGAVDWPAFFATLRASGYAGAVGVEAHVTGPSTPEALAYLRSVAADA